MFTSIYNVLAQWISDFLAWFMGCVYSFAEALLKPLVDMVPNLSETDVSSVVQYCSWANQWIALDFGLILFGGWLLIVCVLISINWTLGLVPTIN